MKQSSFQYTAFPSGLWEITWLGDVKFIRHLQRCYQPVINVTLRSLINHNERKEVNIAVGQMFNLALGTVWEDGRKTDNTAGPAIESTTLSFVTQQAKFIKAGSSISSMVENEFWLPFTQHDHHRKDTESWCILLILNDVDVIIPCSEMLRFYFGSSSNLLKRIICSYFNPFSLWQEHEFDQESHFLKLTLAPEISGASAADIGRILLDKTAYDAVNSVSKILTASIANGEKAYIKMPFPFQGKTKLKVLGRHLTIEGMKNRFMVTQILSCSHPLPFSGLRYVSHTQFKKGVESTQSSTEQLKTSKQGKQAISKETTIEKLVNDEPNANRQTRISTWRVPIRFPDLLCKEVIRITPERTDIIMLGAGNSTGHGSTGNGSGNSNIAKIDLCLDSPFTSIDDKPLKSPVDGWEAYFTFLRGLAEETWISSLSFLRLNPKQVENHYSQLPSFANEYGEITLNSYINPIFVSISRLVTANNKTAFLISFASQTLIDEKYRYFYLVERDDIEISWDYLYSVLTQPQLTIHKKFNYNVLQAKYLIIMLKQDFTIPL